MYIIHNEHLEKVLIDIAPVCKKSSKQSTVAGAVQPVSAARRSGCRKADAEITTHMLADKAQIKGLKVSEMVGMEQHGKGYDFTVRYMEKCGYGAACQIVKVCFFSTQEYNICKNC